MNTRMFFISKFCLLCLKEDDENFQYVGNKDVADVSIQEKLDYCVFELVSSGHEFPGFICQECNEQLEMFYKFKQKCFKSNRKIRNLMESMKQMKFSNISYRELSVPVVNIKNTTSKKAIKNKSLTTKIKKPKNKMKQNLVKQSSKIDTSLELSHFTEEYNRIGEKSYKCKICFAQVTHKASVKRHYMRVHKNPVLYAAPKINIKVSPSRAEKPKEIVQVLNETVDLTEDEDEDEDPKTVNSDVQIVSFGNTIEVEDDDMEENDSNEENTSKTENDGKIFSCFVCAKTFTRNCSLTAHIRKHFEDMPPF